MSEQAEVTNGSEQEGNTPSPAEQNLSPEEQASLKTAREGLPPVDPNPAPADPKARPGNIPEKFWDAEKGEVRLDALATSYSELETKLGNPGEQAEENAEEADDDDDNVEVKDGKINRKAAEEETSEGEDDNPVTSLISTAATEFSDSGEFTEDTAKALAEAGIPAEVQQVYLRGLEAMQQQQAQTVYGFTGGEENYNQMARWAGANLSDAQLDKFNAALADPDLAENAVRGLYARFRSAKPSEGKQVAPNSGVTDGGDTFQTREDMTKALSDPRYKTDPAYQREVVEKLRRTRAQGKSFNR